MATFETAVATMNTKIESAYPMFKSILKRLLGEKTLGALDYFTKPELKKIWGGAFNGQTFRREIFAELSTTLRPKLIVETGSFRGNTTAFMALTGIPIRSVEFSARLFAYVKTRFLFNPKVTISHNDSRAFLRLLAASSKNKSEITLFYLDAHWNEDLPLAEELTIVFKNWPKAVVMVDDFKVPNSDYHFDDYGAGKALTLEYVDAIAEIDPPAAYFPKLSAEQETGAKRGCVVLAQHQSVIEALDQFKTLTRYVR